jgi:hypothetical protein
MALKKGPKMAPQKNPKVGTKKVRAAEKNGLQNGLQKNPKVGTKRSAHVVGPRVGEGRGGEGGWVGSPLRARVEKPRFRETGKKIDFTCLVQIPRFPET